jgi:ribosomal subunit interface protein
MSTNPTHEPSDKRPHHARDTIRSEAGHDPYNLAASLPGPAVCGSCGVAFSDGRWHWLPAGAKAQTGWDRVTCPACRRMDEGFPAGIVVLQGAFLEAHGDDVVALVRAEEELEKKEHPLNRIASFEQSPGRIELTTTDTHLPRRIVYALRRAYEGELALKYAPSAGTVRAEWHRDDPHPPAKAAGHLPFPVEVQAHDITVTPEVNSYLHERIDRLRRFYPRILSCRVVLSAPTGHHRQGGPFDIAVHVEVPGRDAHITRQQDRDLHVAIREAFDATQRVLEDHIRKQRGDVSPTYKPERARVARLFPAEGYGFLEAADGHEVYFHRNSVIGGRFEDLGMDAVVRFAEEAGENGMQATYVAF